MLIFFLDSGILSEREFVFNDLKCMRRLFLNFFVNSVMRLFCSSLAFVMSPIFGKYK